MTRQNERMTIEARSYVDAEGVRIHFDVYSAQSPRGVVQLVHGVGEHAGRYGHVAGALTDAGFTVYAADQRGHGRTGMEQHGRDATRLGRLGPGGLRATIRTASQLTGIIRDENPDSPVVLLGHSWGSFVAQIMLNRHASDFAAAVLTGTVYRWPGYMYSGPLNKRHQHLGTTGAEWLSRDAAVSQAFFDDPLTTNESLQKLFGLTDAARLLGRPSPGMADVPILIQVGSDDILGAERSALKLVDAYRRRAGITDIELIVYEGARHEVFNETNRDEVLADTVGWLSERIPA